MDAKISQAFWDDLEDQPPEVKLTALWTLTNSSRDSCGVFRFSPNRFAFQTGLAPAWLADTLEKLPRMFICDGEKVLIKNFIRHQLGTGPALARNNMAKGLGKPFQLLPAKLQNAILDTYPELKPLLSPCQALPHFDKPLENQPVTTSHSSPESEPNHSLSEALTKDKLREEKRSTPVQGECEGEPTLQEVLTRASLQGMPEAEARAFFEHYAGLGWMYGNTRMAKWWHWLPRWKARAETFAAHKKTPDRAAAQLGSLAAIEEELQWQEDPAKRAELEKKRRELGGAQ